MTPDQKGQLRELPAVGDLLHHDTVRGWLDSAPRSSVVRALQRAVESLRGRILKGQCNHPVDADTVVLLAEDLLTEQREPALQRVINATGIVIHTGLGRAPLCEEAVEAIARAAGGYCNLEFDLDTGRRSDRLERIGQRLCRLTGAEGAMVVNNNAAATLLILQTLAKDREVIVSRGELVEIGGSYRLPDIMVAGGAVLREVGTTNRTHLSDYEAAISDRTAILMRVHASNYRVVGFTCRPPLEQIVELAHRHGLPVVDDLGSGALFDLARLNLPPEPCVADSLAAGTDLVCFSADKLLGGPQGGIIVGRRNLLDRIAANPLARCCRVDKLTLLALEATLQHYEDVDGAVRTVPVLAMLTEATDSLADRARTLCDRLQTALPDEHFYVCSDITYAGGGALPARELPTVVVQWRPATRTVESVAAALRHATVPVVARIREDAICFDLRTVRPEDYQDLIAAAASAAMAESRGLGTED